MVREDALRLAFNPSTCRASTSNPRAINILEERWFGRRSGGELILDLTEVAYLLLEGKLVLEMPGGIQVSSLDEFMKHAGECFKDFFWPQLVVYKDLRDRGRRVKVIDQYKFLVKDKSGNLRFVYVLEEKKLVKMEDIVRELDNARKNSLQPVLAIVSLQGDLTYYEANIISPTVK